MICEKPPQGPNGSLHLVKEGCDLAEVTGLTH